MSNTEGKMGKSGEHWGKAWLNRGQKLAKHKKNKGNAGANKV